MMDALKQSHFEWFGLPERFSVDDDALESAYRRVQAAVHPDRFARALDAERRLALQLATQANHAYRTLKDPVRRATYLCERQGVDLGVETNTAMPADFLMQQMEWREALDEAREALDPVALQAVRGQLDAERSRLLTGLGDSIDERRDFDSAAALVRQLMFVDRFAEDVDAVAERIAEGAAPHGR